MSSIICQGLQSCLEPCIVEKRVLTLRLASPKPQIPQKTEPNTDSQEKEALDCGWSSIYSLVSTQREEVSIPSFRTRSAPTLSSKSLEMCTENLGSETGSDVGQGLDFSSSSPFPDSERKSRLSKRHKNDHCSQFPPPLTTITGQDRIFVRSNREGGRLVLKAIPVPSPPPCFQSDRSSGHLKLRFLDEIEPSEQEVETVDGETEREGEGEAEEEEEEEEEEERSGEVCIEDLNGNERNEGGEIGTDNFQRPSRCKEGGNEGLVCWEHCWVASS